MKAISFFGHSDCECTSELFEKVYALVKYGIMFEGVQIFYFGGFSAFDTMCWEVVTKLREEFSHIQRVFCVPQYKWLRKPPKWFNKTDYEAVEFPTLKFEYWYTSIYYRNCAVIDQSDFIIFYAQERARSGAFKALQYAKKQKKDFINLI